MSKYIAAALAKAKITDKKEGGQQVEPQPAVDAKDAENKGYTPHDDSAYHPKSDLNEPQMTDSSSSGGDEDVSDSDAEGEGDEEEDPEKQYKPGEGRLDPRKLKDIPDNLKDRTYTILLENRTGLSLVMTNWAVRPAKHLDFKLTCYRGAHATFRRTIPKSGTHYEPIPNGEPDIIPLGRIRGPKSFDPRSRWGWIYFDILNDDGSRVYLQVYVRANRNGVAQALIGRTDLDSSYDNPMSSGEFGKGVWDKEKKQVTFVLERSLAGMKNIVDDSVKKASLLVPGKGVRATTRVGVNEARVSVLVGSEARYHEYLVPAYLCADTVRSRRLVHYPPKEISTVHELEGLGGKYVGIFVEFNGREKFSGHVRIDPVTGIARGAKFNSTAESTAVFRKDGSVINYGFHDAGAKRHSQVYVYVTDNHSHWLADLIEEDARFLDLPFCRLALAGSHDAGMYGPFHSGLALLIQQGHLGEFLADSMIGGIAEPVVKTLVDFLELFKLSPERVINNIALTQKDTILSQLKIGIRFFDFRPGYCFHDVIHTERQGIYHQHAMVPGIEYLVFLTTILDFLAKNPKEIVVVELKHDGFAIREDKHNKAGELSVLSMIPTIEELDAVLDKARETCRNPMGKNIRIARGQDMALPIRQLLESNKRLFIIDRMHGNIEWERNDSYDGKKYNTATPEPIMEMLNKTFIESSHPDKENPVGLAPRGCIYQLQATPTSNLRDDLKASVTWSDSSSLLTYVKPLMDSVTYPWISDHKFEEPGTVVFLNDFVDGALVEHALEVTHQRSGFAVEN